MCDICQCSFFEGNFFRLDRCSYCWHSVTDHKKIGKKGQKQMEIDDIQNFEPKNEDVVREKMSRRLSRMVINNKESFQEKIKLFNASPSSIYKIQDNNTPPKNNNISDNDYNTNENTPVKVKPTRRVVPPKITDTNEEWSDEEDNNKQPKNNHSTNPMTKSNIPTKENIPIKIPPKRIINKNTNEEIKGINNNVHTTNISTSLSSLTINNNAASSSLITTTDNNINNITQKNIQDIKSSIQNIYNKRENSNNKFSTRKESSTNDLIESPSPRDESLIIKKQDDEGEFVRPVPKHARTKTNSMPLPDEEGLGPTSDQSSVEDTSVEKKVPRSKYEHVDEEIKETERQYVENLETVINDYIKPIQEMGILDTNQIHGLFSTIQVIHNFNNQLYEDLKNNSSTAQIFNQYFQGFRLYSQYCVDYPKSQNLMNDLLKNNTTFKNFCAEKKKNDKKRLQLQDYLIMPIQRICKYPLLFGELLKCCPETESDDYKMITLVLDNLKKTANHVNAKKLDAERKEMVRTLEKSIYVPKNFQLLEPGRFFVREGVLSLTDESGNSCERTFYLFNDFITQKKSETNGNVDKIFIRFDKNFLLTINPTNITMSYFNRSSNKVCKVVVVSKSEEEMSEWKKSVEEYSSTSRQFNERTKRNEDEQLNEPRKSETKESNETSFANFRKKTKLNKAKNALKDRVQKLAKSLFLVIDSCQNTDDTTNLDNLLEEMENWVEDVEFDTHSPEKIQQFIKETDFATVDDLAKMGVRTLRTKGNNKLIEILNPNISSSAPSSPRVEDTTTTVNTPPNNKTVTEFSDSPKEESLEEIKGRSQSLKHPKNKKLMLLSLFGSSPKNEKIIKQINEEEENKDKDNEKKKLIEEPTVRSQWFIFFFSDLINFRFNCTSRAN
eukprot:TRINITY_DN8645_c0_g1_i1.p1 TRINITY_DN8645_c0_g1~~TRINITY_DN8645_c0_g1_i1.p1  ORF type:complete len:895 (-),score=264.14 TRINITY_DN8645_c0_g1_i1:1640-4324(-)